MRDWRLCCAERDVRSAPSFLVAIPAIPIVPFVANLVPSSKARSYVRSVLVNVRSDALVYIGSVMFSVNCATLPRSQARLQGEFFKPHGLVRHGLVPGESGWHVGTTTPQKRWPPSL